MICTIKNGSWTFFIQAGASARFWTRCIYSVCNPCNGVAVPCSPKTPGELLASVEPSIRDLSIIGCKCWALVPDKSRETLDLRANSDDLLQCLMNVKVRIMLVDDRTVETTCNCLVREDVFHMKQCQNVVRILWSELAKLLMNDCAEIDVRYVEIVYVLLVLDLTGERVERKAGDGGFNLG